jgi:hypothetical protein
MRSVGAVLHQVDAQFPGYGRFSAYTDSVPAIIEPASGKHQIQIMLSSGTQGRKARRLASDGTNMTVPDKSDALLFEEI